MSKQNSNSLTDITKVLELIHKHDNKSNKANTNDQLKDYYINSVKK